MGEIRPRITPQARDLLCTANDHSAGWQNQNKTMKKTLLSIACATVLSSGLYAGEIVTTTGMGTVTEYTPGSAFVVKETSGPVSYTYGDSVTYVTRSGRTLTADEARTHIRVGSPVSVNYITRGTDRVISRVEIDD